jgi:hypothetical protein
VQEANRAAGLLPKLALIGTSMRSMADSALLFDALTTDDGGQAQPGSCSSSSSSSSGGSLIAQLCAGGAVMEAPVPDFACHGVATSLHLFQPGGGL